MRRAGSFLAVLDIIINEPGDLVENFLGKCVYLSVISSGNFLRLFSSIKAESRKLRADSVSKAVFFPEHSFSVE